MITDKDEDDGDGLNMVDNQTKYQTTKQQPTQAQKSKCCDVNRMTIDDLNAEVQQYTSNEEEYSMETNSTEVEKCK